MPSVNPAASNTVEPIIRPGLLLRRFAWLYDALESAWERNAGHRTLGVVLVASFLGSIAVIEINRQGFLPGPVSRALTTNHFGAVTVAFTLLLVIEILALVFALAHSVALSVGKQLELLSLILLRKVFLEIGKFGEPVEWARAADAIPVVMTDLAGALLIFVVVGFYYRIQRHQPITLGEQERVSFLAAKKVVALALLAAFLFLGIVDLSRYVTGAPIFSLFEAFYTVLIFSDILIVLISLCYSAEYHVVFRNSGFAATTVVIRLALAAPPYINALLGLGAALSAVGLSWAYNFFGSAHRTRGAVRARDLPEPAQEGG